MAGRCEVRVLGTFAVTIDGAAVSVDAWRSRRAADVVKVLAIEPSHALHREQVMDLLWPGLNADAAAANLRKALHYARRAMASDEAVVVREGMLVLWPDGTLDVDLDEFEQRTAAALASDDSDACAETAALYGGELLPADRYEPWADEARNRARDRYLSLLRVAGLWTRVLEIDPSDEPAHRALMRRFIDGGDRRGAIRQFEQLREVLREHFGVGPDAETVELYEEALALGGADPTSPAERAAALVAHGLVAWGRRNIAEAERLATEARALAVDAGLGHELGEASTLLALVAYAKGTWHELFRDQFAESIAGGRHLEKAVYDAHLCFQEFYLYGPHGHEGADAFARELLAIADAADSAPGRALATLLLGEFALLSGDVDGAAETLREAVRLADTADTRSALSIALERMAESEIELGDRAGAQKLIARARPYADSCGIPTHATVRLLGVQVRAADGVVEGLNTVREAERWLADQWRVCDPCSMTLRIEAALAYARAGDVGRARQHLAEAERITSLWQGGTPWNAAIWEARAEIRRAEGQLDQARALFLEAAEGFAEVRRPLDEARCRSAAAA